jgi:hypothetical protein
MLTEYELQLAQQIMSLNPGMTPEQAIAEVKGMPPGAQAGQYAGQQGMAQAGLNRQAQAPQPCPTCGGTGVVGKSTDVNDSWPELNIKY